jgi:CheY-like chemotaxis protein
LRKSPDWLLPQLTRLSVQNASDHCCDILVVDESNEIRSLLNSFLGKTGYQLRFCTDASEACWAIESKNPNFVISSGEMPDMNGVELCRRIRQFKRVGYLSF